MSVQQTTQASGPSSRLEAIAVCDKRGPDAAKMSELVLARGWSGLQWYAIRDLDDVDAMAASGRVGTVVFISWRDLLEGIWNGEVNYDRWLAAGVRVDFIESPADPTSCLSTVADAWRFYRKSQKRRHAVAGFVLSIIVLAAAFSIIWLC